MEFKSTYKRPCLATSPTGKSGVIILISGISTAEFQSQEKGREILKELVAGDLVSAHDGERIEDHLNASDLPATEQKEDPRGLSSSILLLAVLGAILEHHSTGSDVHSHKCPKCGTTWDHDGSKLDGRDAAHKCPKCGHEQWERV